MLRVLIVDDEYIMRQGLKYIIDWEAEGFQIVGEAANGADALKMIEECRPHIVFTDIVMPTLGGVEFTEAVRELYPEIRLIVLSGYDKFEYVKQTLQSGAVDYILKPTLNPKEVLRVLRKASEGLPDYLKTEGKDAGSPERSLARFLLGNDPEPSPILQTALPGPYYQIFSANIKLKNKAGTELLNLLYGRLDKELSALNGVTYVRVLLREQFYTAVCSFALSESRELLRSLSAISEKMTGYCEGFFAVAGRRFDALSELKEIYRTDVAPAQESAFYHEHESFFLSEKKETESAPPKFDFFQFNRMISARQYADALSGLREYNRLSLLAHADSIALKNQIKNMLYHFLDSLSLNGEDAEERQYRYFKSIEEAAYQSAYERVTDEIFDELSALSREKAPAADERIEGIIRYISEHYQDDLRLEDLSERFGFNYNYLSTWFNRNMNEGFSGYLTRIRIEKACELLKSTNLPIAGVGEAVGYLDQSYFCRVFKRLVGRTPSKWRYQKD